MTTNRIETKPPSAPKNWLVVNPSTRRQASIFSHAIIPSTSLTHSTPTANLKSPALFQPLSSQAPATVAVQGIHAHVPNKKPLTLTPTSTMHSLDPTNPQSSHPFHITHRHQSLNSCKFLDSIQRTPLPYPCTTTLSNSCPKCTKLPPHPLIVNQRFPSGSQNPSTKFNSS